MSLLEVKKLTKNFGGLAAVSMVSLELGENELIGLIGPRENYCRARKRPLWSGLLFRHGSNGHFATDPRGPRRPPGVRP